MYQRNVLETGSKLGNWKRRTGRGDRLWKSVGLMDCRY